MPEINRHSAPPEIDQARLRPALRNRTRLATPITRRGGTPHRENLRQSTTTPPISISLPDDREAA